ncbi:MAG: menaquinone-dependent protoporphyrinogen IX dehydrogenase [Gammaproteobacteria bacterium]|jgi:menaquinone-dependent protoporphyrinogen oxidase
MANILIVYSTVDGHTRAICAHLGETLTALGNEVDLTPVDELFPAALVACNKVVVGASIRYGKYRPDLVKFVRERADELNARPGAFFTVNLVARKPGRDTPETNPYVAKLLDQTRWRPQETAVFAGKLDYPRYRPLDRQVIRLIMWLTDGPTDPTTVQDFTDWDDVEAFAARIARL